GLQQGPVLGCLAARDRFQGALVSGDRRFEVLGLAAAALGVALPDPPPKAGPRLIPCDRERPRAELALQLQCPLGPRDELRRIARLRKLFPEADELCSPLVLVDFPLLRLSRQLHENRAGQKNAAHRPRQYPPHVALPTCRCTAFT